MSVIPIGIPVPAPAVGVEYSGQAHYLADLTARAAIVVLFSLMAMRFGADFAATGRPTGLLLLVSEALVVILTLVRRPALTVDRSARARMLTILPMMGPPLLMPAAVPSFAPEAATLALSCAGLCVVIAGKISLGRSFAVLPANRGIVSTGLYRVVRHPIYTGYLVTHAAFLLSSPSPWNIVALVAADTALLARAVCEERTLAMDAAYRDYRTRVRWRVAPGLF